MELSQQLREFITSLQKAVSLLIEHPSGNSGEFRFSAGDIFAGEQSLEDREILIGLVNQNLEKTGRGAGLQSQIGLVNDELVLETNDLRRFRDRLPTVEYESRSVSARIEKASGLPSRFK